MGYQDNRPVFPLLCQGTEDNSFIQTVQIAGRFIQQKERRAVEESPGDADALAFPAA